MRLWPDYALELPILGALASVPLTAPGVVAVVRRLGGARFQPTTEVVVGRLAALAGRGLVERAETLDGSEGLLRATAAGIMHARRLMLLRAEQLDPAADEPGADGATALEVCFLDLLEPEARPRVIRALIAHHERELARASAALARCPYRGAFTRRWLAHDVERLAAERRWLRELESSAEAGADTGLTAR